ncbi:MAG: hypothetical protein ABR586_09665 [Thermoplasmatota archaeon]
MHGARLTAIEPDKGTTARITIQTPTGTWTYKATIVQVGLVSVGELVCMLWLDSLTVRLAAKPSEAAA